MSKEIIVRDSRFENVEERIAKMQNRAKEFAQTRSNFQIEKFIACEEYTNITKFRTVSHNSYVTMQEIRRMLIERERKLRDIEKKQKAIDLQIPIEELSKVEKKSASQFNKWVKNVFSNKKFDPHFMDYDLDIYELTRQLEDIEIRIKGLSQEVDFMESICDELEKENGKPFTYEQFQEEEPEYWGKRLLHQMHAAQHGNKLGIGEGNYKSYLQAVENPILPNSVNKSDLIPFENPNVLMYESLKDRKGIGDKLVAVQQNPCERSPHPLLNKFFEEDDGKESK